MYTDTPYDRQRLVSVIALALPRCESIGIFGMGHGQRRLDHAGGRSVEREKEAAAGDPPAFEAPAGGAGWGRGAMAAGLADEEEAMSCVLCRNGTVAPGLVTLAVQRGRPTVILKKVPADVCPNCEEYYLSSETTALVLARADAAARNGAEVEIAAFAA